jgi:uncharacterized protein with HEPN domain
MAKTSRQRLYDAQQAIASIQRLTTSGSRDDFLLNEMLQLAVAFQFGVIGEALKKASELDPSLQVLIPDLRLMIGMRNRIFHAYDEIDFELLWDTIHGDLPELLTLLGSLLSQEDHE